MSKGVQSATPVDPAPYERSARRDLRIWGMFLVGLLFVYAGSVVDPASNCDEAGDCAPWLVPVAFWLGALFAASGAALLLANPRRGSRIDPVTGELVWWQQRLGAAGGHQARIHPSRIGRIRIVQGSDSDDVHLYDLEGERQHFFDTEVIPWPYDRWARVLAEKWPHIRVELS